MIKDRKGYIDGVPESFDTNYVITSGKRCVFCTEALTIKNITENEVIKTVNFDFSHKKCLSKNEIIYNHNKKCDPCSYVVIYNKNDIKTSYKKKKTVSI